MAGGQAGGTAPRTVDGVDLRAYAGTSYEIARFPNRFQTQCAGDVTATYAVRADGRVDVINRCRTCGRHDDRGARHRQTGRPGPVEREAESALRPGHPVVHSQRLGRLLGYLGLGPEYSFAVIGDPSRTYLWILSRTRR